MKIQIINKVHFSAAHFLVDHHNCSRLHGHNYTVDVTLEEIGFARKVNELSTKIETEQAMVLDFSILKQSIEHITNKLDHKVLVPIKNNNISFYASIEKAQAKITVTDLNLKNREYSLPLSDVCALDISETTAELLSIFIANELKQLLQEKIKPYDEGIAYELTVTVWETNTYNATQQILITQFNN